MGNVIHCEYLSPRKMNKFFFRIFCLLVRMYTSKFYKKIRSSKTHPHLSSILKFCHEATHHDGQVEVNYTLFGHVKISSGRPVSWVAQDSYFQHYSFNSILVKLPHRATSNIKATGTSTNPNHSTTHWP